MESEKRWFSATVSVTVKIPYDAAEVAELEREYGFDEVVATVVGDARTYVEHVLDCRPGGIGYPVGLEMRAVAGRMKDV